MRLLLDTNVLISAILFGGVPRVLLESVLRGDLEFATSDFLMSEFERIVADKFGFPQAAARAIRSELEQMAMIVMPSQVPSIVRDPADDEVLAAAGTGQVELIVTGDQDLLTLETYMEILIVSPRRALEIIEGDL